ncbi:hypothetical protein ACFL9T_17210 [Thermodesulfobacteriota bacterium]
MMNRAMIPLICMIMFLPLFSHAAQDQLKEESKIPEFPVSEQSRAVFEKDTILKNSVFKFLYYDSCGKGKARDYKGSYTMLSKDYLSKHFPKIKSAAEYEKDMENSDEIYHHVILMIERVDYIKNDMAKIKLQFEAGNEGVLQKMEAVIFFVKEQGIWKYHGINVSSLKVLETLN